MHRCLIENDLNVLSCSSLPGLLQQIRRDINTGNLCSKARGRDREIACSASDVKNLHASSNSNTRNKLLGSLCRILGYLAKIAAHPDCSQTLF